MSKFDPYRKTGIGGDGPQEQEEPGDRTMAATIMIGFTVIVVILGATEALGW